MIPPIEQGGLEVRDKLIISDSAIFENECVEQSYIKGFTNDTTALSCDSNIIWSAQSVRKYISKIPNFDDSLKTKYLIALDSAYINGVSMSLKEDNYAWENYLTFNNQLKANGFIINNADFTTMLDARNYWGNTALFIDAKTPEMSSPLYVYASGDSKDMTMVTSQCDSGVAYNAGSHYGIGYDAYGNNSILFKGSRSLGSDNDKPMLSLTLPIANAARNVSGGFINLKSEQQITSGSASFNFITIDDSAVSTNNTSKFVQGFVEDTKVWEFNPRIQSGASNTSLYYNTFNTLTDGYRLQFYNGGANPINFEADGSIDLPSGAEYKINGTSISEGAIDISGAPNKAILYKYGDSLSYNTSFKFNPSRLGYEVVSGTFHAGTSTPFHSDSTMNYDGVFRASKLYGLTLTGIGVTGTSNDNSAIYGRGYGVATTGVTGNSDEGTGIESSQTGVNNNTKHNLYVHRYITGAFNATGHLIDIYDQSNNSGARGGNAIQWRTSTIPRFFVNYTGQVKTTQLTAALTDSAPTDAEIDTATGLTPSTATSGYQVTIKDSDGTGLLYKIESDGTDWYYTAMTKAL